MARRQAVRDRRRHLGDPPHADRPRAVRGNHVTGSAGHQAGRRNHPEPPPEPHYNLNTCRKTLTLYCPPAPVDPCPTSPNCSPRRLPTMWRERCSTGSTSTTACSARSATRPS
ncbi:hypothetical protein CBM2614_A20125 [Cupriavidus taiwanensis]|uniref:Uncharacterized protein n=1 Tax=Cupriavidus taiwanensis TaxID=164546 RepID=A0A375E1D8_9BURK|nr:hypothetical protein CBM2614_A20125 [Cupriavidus taiwanensis]SOZ55174.1 hypothetical protein CBM2613_A20127 [Cupriavidus taiwanensis]